MNDGRGLCLVVWLLLRGERLSRRDLCLLVLLRWWWLLLLLLLLLPLLLGLHLFLLLVTSVDRFSHGAANRTSHILTSVVVAEHIPGTHTVRNQALLVLALRYMLPKPFHSGTMRSDRTSAVFVLALGGVPQKQKALLLVTQHLLPVRDWPTRRT